MADKKENKYDLDWLLGFFPFGQPAAREDIPVRGREPAWWSEPEPEPESVPEPEPHPQWPRGRDRRDLDLALQYAVPDLEYAVFGESKSELPKMPPFIYEDKDTVNPILLIGQQEKGIRSRPFDTIDTLRQISTETREPIIDPKIGAYGLTQLEVPTVYTALNRMRINTNDWAEVGNRIQQIGNQELTDAYNIINAAVPDNPILVEPKNDTKEAKAAAAKKQKDAQLDYVVNSGLLDQIRSGNNINIELLLKLFDLNYDRNKRNAYESLVITPEYYPIPMIEPRLPTNEDIQRNVSAIQKESSNRAINYVEIFGLNRNGN